MKPSVLSLEAGTLLCTVRDSPSILVVQRADCDDIGYVGRQGVQLAPRQGPSLRVLGVTLMEELESVRQKLVSGDLLSNEVLEERNLGFFFSVRSIGWLSVPISSNYFQWASSFPGRGGK